jgi:predicted nucleic acid-binding Zn ribbon protein
VIIILYKSCPKCGKKILYDKKYCDECSIKIKDEKVEKNRRYDKNERKNKDVYHNARWTKLTSQCKSKFRGIDIYSWYELGRLEFGDLSHHVVPIDDNSGRQYDITNLIYLNQSNHAYIHGEYNKGIEKKKAMQELLFRLIEQWKKETM